MNRKPTNPDGYKAFATPLTHLSNKELESIMDTDVRESLAREELPTGQPVDPPIDPIDKVDPIDKETYLNWHLEPRAEQWTTTQAHIWTSTCSRYRVVRMVALGGSGGGQGGSKIEFASEYLSPEGTWEISKHTNTSETSPECTDTLEAAFAQVQKFHCQHHRLNESVVTTNALEVVGHAQKLGLDHGRVDSTKEIIAKSSRGRRQGRLPQQFKTRTQKAPKGAGVDEYGTRLGTDAAKINACLSTTEPKDMKQIMAELGFPRPHRNYMKSMVEKGLFQKVGTGWIKVEPKHGQAGDVDMAPTGESESGTQPDSLPGVQPGGVQEDSEGTA